MLLSKEPRMAAGNCNNDQYLISTGNCCNLCGAGSYLKAQCNGTRLSECARCGQGQYTATKNYLRKCHACTVCSSANYQRTVKECTTQEDAVCSCMLGYYCSNDKCDHCQPASSCPLGEGVVAYAVNTTDTVCAPCKDGTYSNVTDFLSPCQAHTRCGDLGKEVSVPGTRTTDAVCGGFKSDCHWMLPAGLWSGLVLTVLLLVCLYCLRRKRKSERSVSIHNSPVDEAPAAPEHYVPSVLRDYGPETCAVYGCERPVYKPDLDLVKGVPVDSTDSCLPLKVSFMECSHENGSTGYCTNNFCRSISEPQEDEWCGT